MTDTVEVKEEFTNNFLFDFSESFEKNKKTSPRRNIELVFRDTCREFRIFGERQEKLFEVFIRYRTTVRIPEGIMERARFLPEEEPALPRPIITTQVEQIKKVNSLPRISVRSGDAPDRHESQLPKGDRNDTD